MKECESEISISMLFMVIIVQVDKEVSGFHVIVIVISLLLHKNSSFIIYLCQSSFFVFSICTLNI
jgi:hypothetical protein